MRMEIYGCWEPYRKYNIIIIIIILFLTYRWLGKFNASPLVITICD